MSSRSRRARAVVTGAGSGIGRAFAVELARRGGRVVCADIDPERAQATVSAIERLGRGYAVPYFCDVARADDVRALSDYSRDYFDAPANLLINNAGVGIGGKSVGDIGLDDWQWALGINLNGMVYGSEIFMPQLRESGRAGLINVASAAAFSAAANMAAYNVGKAGVLALSETIAAESSGTGLAVSVLCPTFVRTNVAVDGRITGNAVQVADSLMRWTGRSPESVAKASLAALDAGRLYVIPQVDARAIWLTKRLLPRTYLHLAGILNRLVLSGDTADQRPTGELLKTGE